LTRNDFVSNSSSCSFVVYIETQQDLDELSKIWKDVRKLTNNHVEVYDNLEDACNRCGMYFTTGYLDNNDWNMIEVGEAINVSSGDDHYLYFEKKFDELRDLFTNNYKFKLYRDYDAHYSTGMDYKEKEKKSCS